MPEYLAPGVYVEEVSFRSKSIEGVSTTTTGFIGPTRFGPVNLEPEIVTNLEQFATLYGGGEQLDWSGKLVDNYVWHAARAFFAEGGQRLYVARVFQPLSGQYPPTAFEDAKVNPSDTDYADGHARTLLPNINDLADNIQIRARFPGAAGNMRVRFTLTLSENVLTGDSTASPPEVDVTGLHEDDIVVLGDVTSPIGSPPGSLAIYRAEKYLAPGDVQSWRFTNGGDIVNLEQMYADPDPKQTDQIRIVRLTVTVRPEGAGAIQVWSDLAPAPNHKSFGANDSIFDRFHANPSNIADQRTLPIVILKGDDLTSGLLVLEALFAAKSSLQTQLLDLTSGVEERSYEIQLKGGNDGVRPELAAYEGIPTDPTSDDKSGFRLFEDIEDISIVAAPGYSFGYETESRWRPIAASIQSQLIIHAQKMKYRIAVLDSADNQTISAVRAMRARINSKYAALYYPWVRIMDPITRQEIYLPPSGFVAGIYARNDINRAVYKAPANEVVNLALGFQNMLNKAQQDVLNPEGINCFRFFEGRGMLLWGARMATDDPEWKYVNLRRYFAYLERSIDRGTQWAVFEPNGDPLWANVRRTIESFLYNEWVNGALLGQTPEKAFFVKCDRSTMTLNDLDNGRLVCLIGVSVVRPAEYVIFRIGQWTADAR